jgi:16S rRNA (cytosine967-C5)-methyltransferase
MDQTIASQLAKILGKLEEIDSLKTSLAQLNTKIENIDKNNEKKLEELERRAHRAGVRIIHTSTATKQEIEKNKETADRLLLDVPCSGLGVLKRNPDAKWKLTPAFMAEIQLTQAQIINDYSAMLKLGGLMVYATCSILPMENQMQVQQFLQNNPNKFELQGEQTIMPSQGFDGFYMACLKKIG